MFVYTINKIIRIYKKKKFQVNILKKKKKTNVNSKYAITRIFKRST